MVFEIYPDASGKSRWRMVAKNGQVVATSGEAFHNPGNARRAVKAFRAQVDTARIVELKTDTRNQKDS